MDSYLAAYSEACVLQQSLVTQSMSGNLAEEWREDHRLQWLHHLPQPKLRYFILAAQRVASRMSGTSVFTSDWIRV
jgi:hypothetical protein